jgi:four helix bundle protein
MELVRECYAIGKKLPAHERYVLSAQLRRSAVSVPANIVEGYTRRKRGEYLYFLSVARSSLEEAECHLQSIEQTALLPACELEHARRVADSTSRMLRRLEQSLQRNGAGES